MGGDPFSKGRQFESWHPILEGNFFTFICCKNWLYRCLFEKTKINEKEAEVGTFFLKELCLIKTIGSIQPSSLWFESCFTTTEQSFLLAMFLYLSRPRETIKNKNFRFISFSTNGTSSCELYFYLLLFFFSFPAKFSLKNFSKSPPKTLTENDSTMEATIIQLGKWFGLSWQCGRFQYLEVRGSNPVYNEHIYRVHNVKKLGMAH